MTTSFTFFTPGVAACDTRQGTQQNARHISAACFIARERSGAVERRQQSPRLAAPAHFVRIARMKRVISALAVILAAVAFACAESPKPPEIPAFAKNVPEIKSRDPVFRFNGKDLDGWYTFLR